MGNNYTKDVLESVLPQNGLYSGMSRLATHSSADNLRGEAHECVIRAPVHRDAITAIVGVRPGLVITGGKDKMIYLYNLDTGECLRRWSGHTREVSRLAYRGVAGRNYLFSGGRDNVLRLWDFKSTDPTYIYDGHQYVITGLQVLDNHRFVSGSRDNTVKLWDIESRKCLRDQNLPQNLVTYICRSKAENIIAQTSEDKEVKLWDYRNLDLICTLPKKQNIQTHCDVSADGQYILSASNGFNGHGCEITMYDVRQRQILREFKGHEMSVHAAIFMTQQITWKQLMLSVSADNTVKVWNVDDGVCLWTEHIASSGDLTCAVSFNDGNIAVGGSNACLCHLRLLGKAGKPHLQPISIQTSLTQSQSNVALR